MTKVEQHVRKRSKLALRTTLSMVALTLAFGWMMILDLRFYGELPDDAIAVVMVVLVIATLVSLLPWKWAPTTTAVIAGISTLGSVANPITIERFTDPETFAFGVSNALIAIFGIVATVFGAMATVELLRSRKSGA